MGRSKFHVTQYRDASGSMAWRVDGRIGGVRFRRNFKTKEEAAVEKVALELQATQSESSRRTVLTWLSTDQVREAEVAFYRLEGHKHSLTFYIDYALANYRGRPS